MHILFLSILSFLIKFFMLFLVAWEEIFAALLKLAYLAGKKMIICAVGPWDFQKDDILCNCKNDYLFSEWTSWPASVYVGWFVKRL